MAMTEQQQVLWQALWDKYTALKNARQKILLIPMDQRPDVEGALNAIESEIEQVSKNMEFLMNGAPIAFPSDEEVRKLRQATGELAQAVATSNAVSGLIKAATGLLQTWPISSSG